MKAGAAQTPAGWKTPRGRLRIDPAYRMPFEQAGLDSLAAVERRFASALGTPRKPVEVRPDALALPGAAPLAVFYKHYTYRTPSWRFLGRRSKARCEFENYAALARLGVPTAERIACGEWRDTLGRLRAAFILTRAIPQATPLTEFWSRHGAPPQGEAARALRRTLVHQAALLTRRLHAAGFFHHDLVWRNILVTWKPPAEPALWLIDCPRGAFDRWSPWRRRRAVKDLASLDKSAARFCTRSERARFVIDYLAGRSLDADARRLLRAVQHYRRTRWPEDWR